MCRLGAVPVRAVMFFNFTFQIPFAGSAIYSSGLDYCDEGANMAHSGGSSRRTVEVVDFRRLFSAAGSGVGSPAGSKNSASASDLSGGAGGRGGGRRGSSLDMLRSVASSAALLEGASPGGGVGGGDGRHLGAEERGEGGGWPSGGRRGSADEGVSTPPRVLASSAPSPRMMMKMQEQLAELRGLGSGSSGIGGDGGVASCSGPAAAVATVAAAVGHSPRPSGMPPLPPSAKSPGQQPRLDSPPWMGE